MTKKLTLLLLLCFLIGNTIWLHARETNYVQGDLLVQITPNANIADIVRDLQTVQGKNTGLVVKKCIAPPFRIYLLQFNPINIRQNDLLQIVRQHPDILVAQNNHILELRDTTPNDSQFNQQWQYINPGGGGAVANADLDAELAWDITTGGVTALGDTIVVAVLDEGCKSDHPDWGDNLWKNYAEIPNNGIDDDSNGYIDDYKGWNIYSEDDNIDGGTFSGGHGTAVAGIVGAQGNNSLGVTGVNWNVKVMFLLASGNESDAIGGYTYAYTMRQRYNQTNGTAGAFVVSTNASWGTDQGQPADAPLWCALYDQMGEVGILSAGATANANFNIDVVGDLPTACPSDYLLSVTNLGSNDIKITQAGYGLTTIDLGAYGEETYTLSYDFGSLGYAGFGGTSGATPHVAGAIALLYSVPCPGFSLFAKADPAAAALAVRQMIMDGTTPNSSLNGITVSGGRLNLYNSVLLMQNYECATNGCTMPYSLYADNITTNSADMYWSSIDTALSYNIHYRINGTTDWTIVNASPVAPYSFTQLLPCTQYEVALQAICDTTQSTLSNVYIFTTDGCCVAPSNINISPTASSAELTWEAITAANTYSIIVTDNNGASNTLTTNAGVNSYTLPNLTACSAYTVQIASSCNAGLSNYSDIYSFNTLGCGVCIDSPYCSNAGSDNFYEWIDQLELGTISNNSGAATDGYSNFTNFSTDLAQGVSYTANITAGFSDTPYLEFIRIWIDYNQNGSFENNGELAYQTANANGEASPMSANFTIPTTALLGSTRMRVAMKYTDSAGDPSAPMPCETFQYGEVEDYCVNISSATACAIVPVNIEISAISYNSAQFTWTGDVACSSYNIQYRAVGATTWYNANSATNSFMLSGLNPNTNYEIQIACNCDAGGSAFSDAFTFTTQPLSSNNPSPNFGLSITPNPFSQQISIATSGTYTCEKAEIRLYDVLGKIAFQQTCPSHSATWQLNLGKLATGVYIAEYFCEGQGISRTKLVKQ
jgi:serine protease